MTNPNSNTAVHLADDYQITDALGGGFLLLYKGYQQGGKIDSSGAGNRVFKSSEDARRLMRKQMEGDIR